MVTPPSTDEIVGVPHASVAVALPRAILIAEEVGLHPSEVLLYVPVNPGGLVSSVHVTILETVAVLPHASVAKNVLTCDLLQLPDIAPSLCVIVGVLQLSVADALPNAAVIADDVGLHPSGTVV